jgi:hypothetical protein
LQRDPGEAEPLQQRTMQRQAAVGLQRPAHANGLGLAIDPIDFTFDTSTKALVRLEGRVPTKIREGEHWSDFDARVEYELMASSYR